MSKKFKRCDMKKVFCYIFPIILALASCLGLLAFSELSLSKAEGNVFSADDGNYTDITVNSENFVTIFSSTSIYDNSNVRVLLEEDIDLLGQDLSTIYSELRVFKGIFDGNGHEISNITFTSATPYYGLFPYAQNATIQNVRITGEVNFDFTDAGNSPIYAGVLVGYGENVVVQNCEAYNVEITSQEDPEEPDSSIAVRNEHSISILVNQNITFGGLVGAVTSLTTAGQNTQSVIRNCINYYDFSLDINRSNRISIGGIVGYMTNGSALVNCLNYGDITLTNGDLTRIDYAISQYLGGICGEMDGSSTSIKNTGYGGEISTSSASTSTNVYVGAIVGYLNCSQASQNYNVNFSYWTQGGVSYLGDGYQIDSDKLSQVSRINRDFLSDSTNFDTVERGFDFDYTWAMIESEILLQNFQEYTFTFNSTHFDNNNIIETAKFSVNGGSQSDEITVKYGQTVRITLTYFEQYEGYYSLERVILNSTSGVSEDNYTASATANAVGAINGYEIDVFACDLTDGTYSFSLVGNVYNCEVVVSDEAIENGQGSIRSVGTGTSSTTYMAPRFSYSNRTLNVQAEGSDIYTFAYWEIYYLDENDEFTSLGTLPDDIRENAVVNIVYGTAPFDREFRLVAYFTDEDAIAVTVGNYDQDMVSSITIRGITYQGDSINVPYNNNMSLIVVTNPGYKMDVDSFVAFIQRLYGTNSTDGLASEPVISADGTTRYQYNINMRYMQGNLTGNQLSLSLYVVEDDSNSGDPLLWVYIVVPIVAVIIIGVIIFIIIRHHHGGSGKAQARKEKKKEENYRDYYV